MNQPRETAYGPLWMLDPLGRSALASIGKHGLRSRVVLVLN